MGGAEGACLTNQKGHIFLDHACVRRRSESWYFYSEHINNAQTVWPSTFIITLAILCGVDGYNMVGNFRGAFIFAFLASQDTFAKIKTAKFFVVKVQSEQSAFQSFLLGTIYITANRSVSASVPLTAIPEAIQEIEVLCKHRWTSRTAAQDWERM